MKNLITYPQDSISFVFGSENGILKLCLPFSTSKTIIKISKMEKYFQKTIDKGEISVYNDTVIRKIHSNGGQKNGGNQKGCIKGY